MIEIISIVAILLSPAVAVLISMRLQDRKERRQHKFSILNTLIATRHEPLSTEAVRALNMIDLAFYDETTVRQRWREYLEMLNNQGLNNPSGWQQQGKKRIELITEMAKDLGYGKAITHLDVDRVYTPVGIVDQFTRNQELLSELLRVLKATKTLHVSTEQPPAQKAEGAP